MDKKTILIADDEYGFRYPWRRFLKDKQFNVIEAADENELFEKISQADILMMDVIFPTDQEGINIVRKLRQDEKTKNIPVIFYSVLNESLCSDKLTGIDKKNYVWLQKPFEYTDLWNALRVLKLVS